MGWVYMDDDGYPAQPVRRAGGGFAAGLFNLFLWALVLLLIAAVSYTLFSEIRGGGSEGVLPVPTAAIRTRPASAPAVQPASGVFTTLPLPAPEPIAPVEVVPVVEVAPQLPPVSADIQALPEYVAPEQASSEIPPDWEQNVFGEQPAPVEAAPVSEVAQPAPEGGVAPAEVSSEANEDWMEFMLSGGKPEDYTGD